MKKHIILLIDQSGSMLYKQYSVIQIINQILKKNTNKMDLVFVSIVFFREEINIVKDYSPIEFIKPFTFLDYSPYGRTAYYDALGTTIGKIEADLKAQYLLDQPDETSIYVLSDEKDNRSVEYSKKDIKKITENFVKSSKQHIFYLNKL